MFPSSVVLMYMLLYNYFGVKMMYFSQGRIKASASGGPCAAPKMPPPRWATFVLVVLYHAYCVCQKSTVPAD